jgi:hypothetical protein
MTNKEWPPEIEGVTWLKTTQEKHDDLKQAIRTAKVSLKKFKARARELHKQGYRTPEELVMAIIERREAVVDAKEAYREWKKTRR